MSPGSRSSAHRRGVIALALAVALGGCAGVSDETGLNMMTVSGRYREYTCSDLAVSMKIADPNGVFAGLRPARRAPIHGDVAIE